MTRDEAVRGTGQEEPLGDVLEFMRLLWAVDHGLQSTSKRMERALGVSDQQRLVIRIVGRFPGISAGRVASILHLHPSSLTGVLDRLVRRGFIERRADPSDGRRALFDLKKRGVELNRSRAHTVEAVVKEVLGRSRADIDATRRVLTFLGDRLAAQNLRLRQRS